MITKLKFVVPVNDFSIFQNCFASSPFVSVIMNQNENVVICYNSRNKPLPSIFNKVIEKILDKDLWLVFCHQDFILKEDLALRLEGKNKETIYGPIGVRLDTDEFLGQITNTDGTMSGTFLKEDVAVDTLDAQCLIAHTRVFKKGLQFDNQFRFHFYDADFCMQAHKMGFSVFAMQIACQHKSKTLTGDVSSKEYYSSRNKFAKKWHSYLPIKTTNSLVTERHRVKTLLRVANKTLHGAALIAELKLGKIVKPKHLWLETTDRCNSRCSTCNIWKKPHTPATSLVSLDELKHCFHDKVLTDIVEVLNSGGEATLVNLEDYLEIEHEFFPNASLQISSNALLPERLAEACEYAMEIGVQHLDVGLSIDGIGEAHDVVRGVPGNFVKLERSIGLIKQLEKKYPQRIFTSMGSTLTDFTAKSAEELYAYSRKTCIPFMWHWPNMSSFYENEQKPIATVEGIKDVILNYPTQSLYMDMWQQSLTTGIIPKFRCLALQRFLIIRCNGDVVPCLSKWNDSVGNVKLQSLSEIWYGKKASDERRKIADCEGCLNSWGSIGWSINETYLPLLKDIIKKKAHF